MHFFTFALSYGFEPHVVHALRCSVYHILEEMSLLFILCLK